MNIKDEIVFAFHEASKISPINSNYDKMDELKFYPNCKRILLKPKTLFKPEKSFEQCLNQRISTREFRKDIIEFEKLSELFNLSLGLKDMKNRNYPSAGNRCPIETYYVNFYDNDDLYSGIYHYCLLDNSLELIIKGNFKDDMFKYCNKQSFVQEASGIILFTSIFGRTMDKYDVRGYRYIFLDAGHMGQNLYLTASYLNLGIVAIGGFCDDELNYLLRLDPSTESVIYAFALGSI